jgi:hypothetical protein
MRNSRECKKEKTLVAEDEGIKEGKQRRGTKKDRKKMNRAEEQ